MDTEPFDETELLALPASPVASPPRRLKRLKKFSSQTTATITTATTISLPAGSPPPSLSSPPQAEATPGQETLAPSPSPRPPTPPDADAPTPLPHSSPAPVSSPLPPTDTPDDDSDEDGSLDPLFSETITTVGGTRWARRPKGTVRRTTTGSATAASWRSCGGSRCRPRSGSTWTKLTGRWPLGAGAEAKGKRSKMKRKVEASPNECPGEEAV